MSESLSKRALKKILGELPFTAELYFLLRNYEQPSTAKYSLAFLKRALSGWCTQVERSPFWQGNASQPSAPAGKGLGKKALIFGEGRFWIEHTTLLGCALAGLGHEITLAYLPYAYWQTPVERFDARRNDLYTREVLKPAERIMRVVSFFDPKPALISDLSRRSARKTLPAELEAAVRHVALRDTQYTLQLERVELDSSLYRLRLERNLEACHIALDYFRANRPDVVILPNGTILEYGVLYQAAKYLHIPVVTYEFGEQKQRIWLAQNAEVMRQETDDLWDALGGKPLSDAQLAQVRQLFSARRGASLWENFSRRWQGTPNEGGEQVRAALKLDAGEDGARRPVVLLATNVIGDSLTLDRQVFSSSMTEWIERTVEYFYRCQQAQLVIRIHPGELVTKGPSVAEVVIQKIAALSGAPAGTFPEHIHLIPADAKINTYDIVEIADLGLVYTTTVGMEMAMSGLPVIPAGRTHYRSKGFTLDVSSWEEYFDLLNRVIAAPADYRLTKEQVDQAWNYAYRFFFDYPLPFPWHVLHLQKDVEVTPLEHVWSEAGQQTYGKTFRYLMGEPIQWA